MRPNTGKQWHTSHFDHELLACGLEGRCGAVGVRALYITHAQVYRYMYVTLHGSYGCCRPFGQMSISSSTVVTSLVLSFEGFNVEGIEALNSATCIGRVPGLVHQLVLLCGCDHLSQGAQRLAIGSSFLGSGCRVKSLGLRFHM